MGYRTIEVCGKQYQYVVGKTHLKVRGMEAVPVEQGGSLHERVCGCCGELMSALHGELTSNRFARRVTPEDVRKYIETQSR